MDRWIDGAHIGKLHMYVVLLLFLITHNGKETNVTKNDQILLHFVLSRYSVRIVKQPS